MNKDFQFEQAINSYVSYYVPEWVPAFGILLMLLFIWSLVWKGIALWHAGRRSHVTWFIILLLVNTLGLLEIIYLFFVLKLKFSQLFSANLKTL